MVSDVSKKRHVFIFSVKWLFFLGLVDHEYEGITALPNDTTDILNAEKYV
jgi:hypothetical protein